MPDRVRINDVSPRDGLQNEPGVIATKDKVRLVELLAASGVDEVEVTSFVSPKWIPQLGDAAEVCAGLADKKPAGVSFSALVPNEKGMEALLEVNRRAGFALIDKVSVFTAASETFSKKNTNATIAETLERFRPIAAMARDHKLAVRGYISCVIACPFEGPTPGEAVRRVVDGLIRLSPEPGKGQSSAIDEIDLGDTIGAGTPESVRAMLQEAFNASAEAKTMAAQGKFVLHLHDTFGRAAGCVEAALASGVRSFDGSAAGLGGCPYASKPGARAPGNIDTDLLVRTVHAAGYETEVDLGKLAEASVFARRLVARAQAEPQP